MNILRPKTARPADPPWHHHDTWCRKIVRACYLALGGKFLVLTLVWFFFARAATLSPGTYWGEYVFLPTMIELAVTSFVYVWMLKRWGSLQMRRYAVLLLLLFLCLFFTLFYRVFLSLLASFLIPVFVSSIYSNRKILLHTTLLSAACVPVCAAVFAHNMPQVYGTHIFLEMWTVLALLLATYLLVRVLIDFNRETLTSLRASYESQVDLEELLRRDLFTGLLNRSMFDRLLPKLVAQSRARGRPLCLALLDMDDFKKTNDLLGHAGGDDVLRLLSEILLKQEKNGAMVFRYGGEEFGLLFDGVPLEKARAACEEMRLEMERESQQQQNRCATFSCGLALLADGHTEHTFFRAADEALYLAKRSGKNQLVVAGTPQASGGSGGRFLFDI